MAVPQRRQSATVRTNNFFIFSYLHRRKKELLMLHELRKRVEDCASKLPGFLEISHDRPGGHSNANLSNGIPSFQF
jgi:hypothetical protein